jgi:phosphoadenosine phosphosulfate reductase
MSATMTPTEPELAEANRALAEATPEDVVRWAADRFGNRLVLTSSFGVESAATLHLVTRVLPEVPVLLVDTGYLFPETYRFAEELRQRLDLRLHVFAPEMTAARFEALYGKLWEEGPEGEARYLQMRKREPLERALQAFEARAWIAGLRAEQTDYRAGLRRVEEQDGRHKIHPILPWSKRDLHAYMKAHDLPYHPLYHQGYASVGDVHSSFPIPDPRSERGRFLSGRQECGLHLPGSAGEDQSWSSSGL